MGQVFVGFTVAADGMIKDIAIVRGFRDDCDLAVVRAVQQLPQFSPGRQLGRGVPVRFTMSIRFQPPAAPPADSTASR
ncbi:hypothetical protein BEN49_14805 [Hymenobacter coccineus]|uniref:TonB C-terminal domain-containing protein n=1 Tax=Hymenobacter coccineus TaxID=1908235 RepID=A0A1G1STD8_9BACT|nr:hypothetical protein BEN49_14805 [Hymenobacter coccineus]